MRPSRLSLQLAIGLLLLALAAGWVTALALAWLLALGLFLAALLFDYLLGRKPAPLAFSRRIPQNLPVNVWTRVNLRVRNEGDATLNLVCHDFHPASFMSRGLPARLQLRSGQSAEIPYQVQPQQRGDAVFTGIDAIHLSPLGLWRSRHNYPLAAQVKVYPNYAEVSRYMLMATDNRLSQLGVKQKLRRGDGNEFLQLREYRSGDEMRRIDWKATARIGKLISREYQDEKDQQIVFLVDCGRRMRHQSGQLSHLDQTLNSMLLLAYVAVTQGDAVGFMSFAGQDRWFAPEKGQRTVNRLLNRIYDLHSTTDSPDYVNAARRLLGLQQRRALVVILTNTRDEDDADLNTAIQLLETRHLVVLADLRESVLDEVRQREIGNLWQALDYLSVNEYLGKRGQHHEQLSRRGSFVVDVTAEQLPIAIVNQYLDLKRAALI